MKLNYNGTIIDVEYLIIKAEQEEITLLENHEPCVGIGYIKKTGPSFIGKEFVDKKGCFKFFNNCLYFSN